MSNLVTQCPNFETCSVNDCPLYTESYTNEKDAEKRCPLSNNEIKAVKSNLAAKREVTEDLSNIFSQAQQNKLRKADGSLYVMNKEQADKVHYMVKWNCFYCDGVHCSALSKGDYLCKCPQLVSYTVCCVWCADAVISLNKALDKEIFSEKNKTTLNDIKERKSNKKELITYTPREEPKIITSVQAKVANLIQKCCCNYSGGECERSEKDCSQKTSKTLNCAWFKTAVLPLDRILEIEINNLNSTQEQKQTQTEKPETLKYVPRVRQKQCDICGKTFTSIARNTRHCPKCAIKLQRKQQAEYNRKRREQTTKKMV